MNRSARRQSYKFGDNSEHQFYKSIEKLPLEHIQRAREELLDRVVGFFSKQHGVVGLLQVGSIPNGSADAYSDIDLRVLTTSESHADFVERRLELPSKWRELLFNE